MTLSKNSTTSQAVFEDESCQDVLMELLQTQRESPDLFLKTANLLLTGCQSTSFAIDLRTSAKRIASIHALLSRKLEMNTRYQQPGSAIHLKLQLNLLEKSVKAMVALQSYIRQ